MRDEIKFDEDGAPVRRLTIQLAGRTDAEIDADLGKVAALLRDSGSEPEAENRSEAEG